jgi:hypothetical protein
MLTGQRVPDEIEVCLRALVDSLAVATGVTSLRTRTDGYHVVVGARYGQGDHVEILRWRKEDLSYEWQQFLRSIREKVAEHSPVTAGVAAREVEAKRLKSYAAQWKVRLR